MAGKSKGILSRIDERGWAIVATLVTAVGSLTIWVVKSEANNIMLKHEELVSVVKKLEERNSIQREVMVEMIRGEPDKLKLLAMLSKDQRLVSGIELFEKGKYTAAIKSLEGVRDPKERVVVRASMLELLTAKSLDPRTNQDEQKEIQAALGIRMIDLIDPDRPGIHAHFEFKNPPTRDREEQEGQSP